MTDHGLSERALMLAPRGRDAAIAAAMLAENDIAAQPCSSVAALVDAFADGVGFVVITEEALATTDLQPLSAWIAGQPEWSDLPFILLTTRGGGLERNPAAARLLNILGNVTFLERPFHPTTLISLAQSALRGRRRQYEASARLRELSEGAERYRSLFNSIDAGFCIVEVIFSDDARPIDYRFVEVNPAFVRQTGLAHAPGRRMSELAPDYERPWLDIYGKVAVGGEAVRFEHAAAARQRWYDVYAFRAGDPASRRVAVLFTDVSARRRVEQELRELTASLEERVDAALAERQAALAQLHEAQKLETLGQLTGGVAHDFNNLLMPITGVLDLMHRRYSGQDARAARLIGGAMESAERARMLVQRLLGFARRQALQTRAVDLRALLEGMGDLIASSIGSTIELTIQADEPLPPALVDPNQLELAILNLCVNARDAMPGGGELTLRARTATAGAGQLPSLAPGDYLELSVIDTGIGMDEPTRIRAIEPFYSTKEIGRGTGLGLSMVHGLASQLGGGFNLTSAPGAGTRVDLWLPVAVDAVAEPAREPVAPVAWATRHLSILLVDDEALVRAATAEMLREQGHAVVEVGSGQEALAALDPASIDVVVTDYQMPRMDGAELAARVRQEHPDVPVLLITGYSGPAEQAADIPRLDKPFRGSELAAVLQRLTQPRDVSCRAS